MKIGKFSVKNRTDTIAQTIVFVILVLTASVFTALTRAQTTPGGQSLEVSPPSQEIKANPGQTIEVKAKIRNRSENAVPITVRLEDFVASGSEGQVALTEKGPWAVTSWAEVTPDRFELAGGQTGEVTATVNIPAGTAGGRYGAFVFTVSGKAEAGRTTLAQEIASLFLVDIAGSRDEKLTITSFTAPEFSEFGPIPLDLVFKNSGNVHLRPAGVIAVSDMFGRKILDIPQTVTNVFPGAGRKTSLKWEEKLLIGRYTAQAIINTNGSPNKTLIAQTSFVVFPIRIFAIIILVVTLIILMRKRLGKAGKALMGK